jgi:hypothetical protein
MAIIDGHLLHNYDHVGSEEIAKVITHHDRIADTWLKYCGPGGKRIKQTSTCSIGGNLSARLKEGLDDDPNTRGRRKGYL